MTMPAIGPWVLLAVGAIVLLGALWGTLKPNGPKSLWLAWIFGLACAGTGIYGPMFLSSYADFLKTLEQLQSNPSQETYTTALQKIADGEFTPQQSDVVLRYLTSQPSEGLDTLLTRYSQNAKDSVAKQQLAESGTALSQRLALVGKGAEKLDAEGTLQQRVTSFDQTTKNLIANSVLKKPDSEISALKFNKDALKNWARTEKFNVEKYK